MKKIKDSTWVIIFIIILLAIIFILSAGYFDSDKLNKVKVPDEFKDSKEEAKRKHKRLIAIVNKQESLKIKLNKWFKRTYFIIRFVFILLWLLFLYVLSLVNLVNNIGDALNYSEAIILFFIAMNFLTFGSISNLEKFVDALKTKTENWIYGKYVNIDEKIELNKSEIAKLSEIIK